MKFLPLISLLGNWSLGFLLFSKIKCFTDSISPSLTAINKLLVFGLDFFLVVVANEVVGDVVKVVSEADVVVVEVELVVIIAAALATVAALVVCAFEVAPLVTGSFSNVSAAKK